MNSPKTTVSAAGQRSTAYYETWTLDTYDLWVLGFINTFGWRCGTKKHLLPAFRASVRPNHMDIGVGTGYYLKHVDFPGSLTLCDLSRSALEMARSRSGRDDVQLIHCDITQELPTDEKYQSISMFYLLHCLPGPITNKTAVIHRVTSNLTTDGILAGATILGRGVKDGWVGKLWRRHVNRRGHLDNNDDDAESFISALNDNFEHVETEIVGAVLIFKAQRPKAVGMS
ncbi:hypothetical protein FE257_010113 [Aspergillus nanangensis]|uniref:Methyltransferase domain-containing protein n=1 Tax=Aspergillus nanangensis TaxID=2582783 RepID=A0AAD4CJ96_ASPNN|nr:hypothetical protein FE257_010113 [Aspergillus nanangensis]